MPQRPVQGGSPNTWGSELDAYLDVSLDPSTGNIRPEAVWSAYGAAEQVLVWDAAANNGQGDYSPASAKASTLPKEFRGPKDPAMIAGVALNAYDIWIEF